MQGGSERRCLNHSPGDLEQSPQISSPGMKQCFECKEHAVPRDIVSLVLVTMEKENKTVELLR